MVGSSDDGAISGTLATDLSMGPGSVDATEMQAPSMAAERNTVTRRRVLFTKVVMLAVSGIDGGKTRILGVLHGA